ncbi:MAG: YdcF family protein [Clostridia bacterium]
MKQSTLRPRHSLSLAKRMLAVCLAFFVAGLLCYGGTISYVCFAEKRIPKPTHDYDSIVVLGAQVKSCGLASLTLTRRMTLALAHYQASPQLMICCGGQGDNEPVAEGDFMRDWMIRHGVHEEDVISENCSRNTRENIGNAKEILDARGLSRPLVITSDYHVPRALATCRSAGLTAMGDGSTSQPEMWLKNHLREALSWIKFGVGL